MRIYYTTITEGANLGGYKVRMEISDRTPEDEPKEFVDLAVIVGIADRSPPLAELQETALLRAQKLINAEIARLRS
jgi:hypothetical protein